MAHRTTNKSTGSLRLVAIFEAAKGILVLLVGFGVLGLLHAGAQQAAEELVRHFHLNPASRFPHIFIALSQKTTNSTLWLLAGAAFLYALLRLIEAYGLWHRQRWAEWFGTWSCLVYLPIEIYELLHGVSWPKVALLVINLACLFLLVHALRLPGRLP